MTEDIAAEGLLRKGLEQLGAGEGSAFDRLIAYADLLLRENRKTNLTGARNRQALVVEHILDSLAPLHLIKLRPLVLDLGSGAGLPGLPAAICNPSVGFAVLEPRRKRAEFLRVAVAQLDLRNVTVRQETADAARRKGETAATVLMRAVAPPGRALELGLPLVRGGGTLLLYEGRAGRATEQDAKMASKMGGGPIRVVPVHVPFLAAERHAWIIHRRSSPR